MAQKKVEVRMLSNMAGEGRDELWEYGKAYEVDKPFADRLIASDLAELVEAKANSDVKPATGAATS